MIKEIYPLNKATVTPRKDLVQHENLEYLKYSLPPRSKKRLPFKTIPSNCQPTTSHHHSAVPRSSNPLNLSYDSDFERPKKKVPRKYVFPTYSDDDSDMESDCEIIFSQKKH